MVTLIPAAAMFLRGDVAPAKQQVVAVLDRQQELDLCLASLRGVWLTSARVASRPRRRRPSRGTGGRGSEVPPTPCGQARSSCRLTTLCPIPASWSGTCVAPVMAW